MTEEQLEKLTEHLRFDKFKQNEAVNGENEKELGFLNTNGNFLRKGKKFDQEFKICTQYPLNPCFKVRQVTGRIISVRN